VETNRRGYEAAGQRDYIPGGCGTDVALQLWCPPKRLLPSKTHTRRGW
jgi:hypothetical protein